MGITPVIAAPRDLDEEQRRDIERFERAIAQYLAGEIGEDVFRVMRLNNGIYGQRQGGTNQMVRIKLPAGTITPEQSSKVVVEPVADPLDRVDDVAPLVGTLDACGQVAFLHRKRPRFAGIAQQRIRRLGPRTVSRTKHVRR